MVFVRGQMFNNVFKMLGYNKVKGTSLIVNDTINNVLLCIEIVPK